MAKVFKFKADAIKVNAAIETVKQFFSLAEEEGFLIEEWECYCPRRGAQIRGVNKWEK